MNTLQRLSLTLGSLAVLSLAVVQGAGAAMMPSFNQGTAWWKSVPSATSYNIYYKESTNKNWTHAVVMLPWNSQQYTIRHLKKGVSYWYRVAAVHNGTEFWWSKSQRLQTSAMMNK